MSDQLSSVFTKIPVRNWHTITESAAFAALDSVNTGLSAEEAAYRLTSHGANEIQQGKRKTFLKILLSQFADLMIWVLIAAGAVSLLLGEWADAAIIYVVVLLNAVLGSIQESRAEAALDALQSLAAPKAKALRAGASAMIPASQLVPGDVILLEAGDAIPADARLITSSALKAEESALTGESVPVDKSPCIIEDEGAALGDRVNMVFMGTTITYGRASALVVETGMRTQIGSIASRLNAVEKERTPLQKALNKISNTLSIGVLAVAAIVFALSLFARSGSVVESFLLAVSLAVAAIPEGMVAAVTIVLALGMNRMAGRGAIIRRLPAVETLGATQVICSDKTGTLTQNRMTVVNIWSHNENLLEQAMAHDNDSTLNADGIPLGDPTETALITYLLDRNATTVTELRERKRAGELPFDSERKLSTVAVRYGQGLRVFVKGAPDVMFGRCNLTDDERGNAEAENERMARQALRVLAFAYKDVNAAAFESVDEPEHGLTLIGLCGMIDPARPEARDAISLCRHAGILPVMITGDHRTTAVAIARDLGIMKPTDDDAECSRTGSELERMTDAELESQVENIRVYARVAPEHKSRIVAAWKRRGKVVSMTGDGVNDAPALRSADIGVAMGITGTDVSRGASDMILTDDNFATIVAAVGEGRRIYDNIHKMVRFLLSSNAGEVLAILAATLMGWRLLAPVHVLWINLVTDTFPALALGVEPAERDIMDRMPRDPNAPFFSARDWVRVASAGAVEALLTLAAYVIGGVGTAAGTTMAFLTLALSQLFAALGFQSERTSVFRMGGGHKVLWLAMIGSAVLQLVTVMIPALRSVFGLTAPNAWQWLTIVGLCAAMMGYIEINKLSNRGKRK
ncbi:ATPase [Clostridia bacterium]|nr:ATPase [Clostridia bacterium]